MSESLPAHIRDFITGHIRSIAQLELLLALQNEPDRSWSVADAAKALYTAESMTGPLIESLRGVGLVAVQPDGTYKYSPKTPDLAKTVAELAQFYQERRVTIINLIYSAPIDKLQSFADAFRIRKRPEDP